MPSTKRDAKAFMAGWEKLVLLTGVNTVKPPSCWRSMALFVFGHQPLSEDGTQTEWISGRLQPKRVDRLWGKERAEIFFARDQLREPLECHL